MPPLCLGKVLSFLSISANPCNSSACAVIHHPSMPLSPLPHVSALRTLHPLFLSLNFPHLVMVPSFTSSPMFPHPLSTLLFLLPLLLSYPQAGTLCTCPARIHCARSQLFPLSQQHEQPGSQAQQRALKGQHLVSRRLISSLSLSIPFAAYFPFFFLTLFLLLSLMVDPLRLRSHLGT